MLLVFLHRFKQSRLYFGWRTVAHLPKQNYAKIGPFFIENSFGFNVVNHFPTTSAGKIGVNWIRLKLSMNSL
jgi:hypothetical protein